jgi:regulatory protein
MVQITDLQVQKHNPRRLSVFLDGEYAFGVERIVAAWLSVGDEVNREEIEILLQKDERERAYLRALQLVNVRPRSMREVTTRLDKAGYGEDTIANTIERMQIAGLIDDAKFAQTWVENRCTFRPRSKRILVYELHQKGLSDQEIQSAVSDLDESNLALKLAEKCASRCKDLPFEQFRKKMYGYLSRRGFGYETVAEVIQKTWQSQQVEADTLK